ERNFRVEKEKLWCISIHRLSKLFSVFLGSGPLVFAHRFDPARKHPTHKNTISMRKESTFLILLCCLLFIQNNTTAQSRKEVKKGNNLYAEQKYEEAQKAYEAAIKEEPDQFRARYNSGNAQYRLQQFEKTRKTLETAKKKTKENVQLANSDYNIGNTYLSEKKWAERSEERRVVTEWKDR